ncbi:MAG: SlyX family protein [Gammaproteobacteria bacterium]
MNEDIVMQLQSKIVYQEDAIQELGAVVIAMQKQIDGLEICCKELTDRMREVSGSLGGGSDYDDKPPHY